MTKLRKLFRRRGDVVPFEGPVTPETLRLWLIDRLAAQIKVPASEVDTAKSFEAYGLDSMVAVEVSGSLEKIVERRLSPGLLYEFPTIDELSGYLSRELELADTDPL